MKTSLLMALTALPLWGCSMFQDDPNDGYRQTLPNPYAPGSNAWYARNGYNQGAQAHNADISNRELEAARAEREEARRYREAHP